MSFIGDKIEDIKDWTMDLSAIRWVRSFRGNVAVMADELSSVGYEEDIKKWRELIENYVTLSDELMKDNKKMKRTQLAIERAQKIIENKGENAVSTTKKNHYYFANNHTYYKSYRQIVKAAKRDLKMNKKQQKILLEEIKAKVKQLRKEEKKVRKQEKDIRKNWRANNQKIKLVKYYEEHEDIITKTYQNNGQIDKLISLMAFLKSKDSKDKYTQSELKKIRKEIKENVHQFKKEERKNKFRRFISKSKKEEKPTAEEKSGHQSYIEQFRSDYPPVEQEGKNEQHSNDAKEKNGENTQHETNEPDQNSEGDGR